MWEPAQWETEFRAGLEYDAFLEKFATPQHRDRWKTVYDQLRLTDAQREMLAGFTRRMHILCVTGAWCGDCVRQCPIIQRIAEAAPMISYRLVDRDDRPDVQREVALNQGLRVPVFVFLSEDFHECGRYGDRVLAYYRQMAQDQLGPACPTGIVAPGSQLLQEATQQWLNEVERVQLMLRLSKRLRARHGD
ncbi:MAG: thioredoxin family protein [Armatimonadetes bacterium]|nr:thioredoxin family protein [Armatimonadota bacterium]